MFHFKLHDVTQTNIQSAAAVLNVEELKDAFPKGRFGKRRKQGIYNGGFSFALGRKKPFSKGSSTS